jgi:hypothetical protein
MNPVDASHDVLHRAGWSVGDARITMLHVLVWLVTCTRGQKAVQYYTPGEQLSRLIGAGYNQRVGATGPGTLVPLAPAPTRRNTMQRSQHRPAPPRNAR